MAIDKEEREEEEEEKREVYSSPENWPRERKEDVGEENIWKKKNPFKVFRFNWGQKRKVAQK